MSWGIKFVLFLIALAFAPAFYDYYTADKDVFAIAHGERR